MYRASVVQKSEKWPNAAPGRLCSGNMTAQTLSAARRIVNNPVNQVY
jgi:hypothetical protein